MLGTGKSVIETDCHIHQLFPLQGGCRTGNGKKVSNRQACCLTQLWLAVAYFLSISCGPSTPSTLYKNVLFETKNCPIKRFSYYPESYYPISIVRTHQCITKVVPPARRPPQLVAVSHDPEPDGDPAHPQKKHPSRKHSIISPKVANPILFSA